MKSATNRDRGLVIDVVRRSDLRDSALVDNHDLVRQRHRLHLIVGHEDTGGADSVVELAQLASHRGSQLRVEVGKRFVEQEHPRLPRDGPGDCHALSLATGQMSGLAVEQVVDLEHGCDLQNLGLPLVLRHSGHAQAIPDVPGHAEVRIERIVLKDHGAPPVLGSHGIDSPSRDMDLSRRDLLQSRDHPKQRRFSTSRRPENDHEFVLLELRVHIMDDVGLAIQLVDCAQLDKGHLDSRIGCW